LTRALVDFASVVLATALVLAGAMRATRAAGIRGRIDLLVVVPILAAAQIIATLGFAGVILHRLDAVTLLVVTAVVSGALLVFVRPVARRPRPSLRDAVRSARAHPLIGTLAVLAALAIAWRVVLALLLPPYGYDPLHYHLPTVIGWVQSHRIVTSPLNTCCAYYPENGELLMTWPAVLGGGIEYIDLVQIAAALVGAAGVAGIARAARLSREGMVAAASLFLLTPILLEQANTSDVDVTFTATALAAYYLVLRALESAGRRRWLFFGAAGVAAGLCVGVKPQGSEFLATLALPLVVAVLARRRRWPWRETRIATALFTAPVAIFGVSWYIRSWLRTGSPYYPMEVKLGGVTIFDGKNHLTGAPPHLAQYPKLLQPLISWRSDLHFWTRSGYTLGGFQLGGLGPVWSYFGVIGVVLFAIYAWRQCRPVFWFFLLPTALLFAVQPDNWYSRYTIVIAAAGAVAVAWLMTGTRLRRTRVVLRVATLVLAAGAGFIATRTVVPTAGFANLGLKAVVSDAIHGRRTVGTVFESSYLWIDKIHGEPIAVDPGSAQLFAPLAGRHFENKLVVLPPRTNLVRFVANNDVAYVAALRGSFYDHVAQVDRGTFKFVGGKKLHGYRVLKRLIETSPRVTMGR
jgi:hypothetical protein